MACNNIPVKTTERSTVKTDQETSRQQAGGQNGKHRFCDPWEDSDLVLVVEQEKFHVHRLILSMNSPVFKAMFTGQFKEATSSEIPLPGKKANEILDFLQHIYYQHIQEPVEITMHNVEYLLKLSDEYQVKLIFKPCVKFLTDVQKTKENVMKLLLLADRYHLDNIRQGCCDNLLKNMKLKTMLEAVDFRDLEKDTLQYVLSERIIRLEVFLDSLYPQFLGLVECLLSAFSEPGKHYDQVDWCTRHFDDITGNFLRKFKIDDAKIRGCPGCRKMLCSLVQATSSEVRPTRLGRSRVYCYGSGIDSHHFDENLLAIINDFVKLKHAGLMTTDKQHQSVAFAWP